MRVKTHHQKYPDHRITFSMRSRGRMLTDGSTGRLYDFSVVTPARPAWVSADPGVDLVSVAENARHYEKASPGLRLEVHIYNNGALVART